LRIKLSISLRLTLWFTAIFLCGFITFGALLLFTVTSSLNNSRDVKLEQRADRIAETSDSLSASDWTAASADVHMLETYVLDGRPLTQKEWVNAHFPWPLVPTGQSRFRMSTSFGGQVYRVFVLTTSASGKRIRIYVARKLTDNPSLLDQPVWLLIRFMPPMLLVSALAGYFISRRALSPVARITDSVRSITIGNLAARLPVSSADDELTRLADTCNEMLERLQQAVTRITQFTADASHELRSPIAFIRATSEYALHSPNLDTETSEAFQSIVSETDHSLHLLEDMLLLARFDAGRATLAFEPTSLAGIAQGVTTRMRVLAQEKGHDLRETIPDEGLLISADPLMLRRLIWILLDNAIKYTPDGGSIEITLQQRGHCALLMVSDSGAGIPESLLTKIFDRFFRVDPSRGEPSGTGLGLAIAKRIADTHCAKIVARNKMAAGATFEVSFPLVERQI
jgi:Signal transduction histidine kinase